MKIVQATIPVEKLAGITIDLARIIGIAVANNKAYFMMFDLPATIADKMKAKIPTWQLPDTYPLSFVKSVQTKNSLLIAEVEGPLTTAVKDVVDIIAEKLKAVSMITGFFPACEGLKKSQCYYGTAADHLRNVDRGVENVRFMDDAERLLFTQQEDGRLYMLPLSKIDQPWVQTAMLAHIFRQPISFLGRVRMNKVDVVLKDNSALRATMGVAATSSIRESSLLKQGATAVFGTIEAAGNVFLAALQERNIVLIPA